MRYLFPFLLFAAFLFPPILQEVHALSPQAGLIAKHGGGGHHGGSRHHGGGGHHFGHHHGGRHGWSGWGDDGWGGYYSDWGYGTYYYPYGSYYYYYPNYYYPNVFFNTYPNSGYHYSLDPTTYYYWFR